MPNQTAIHPLLQQQIVCVVLADRRLLSLLPPAFHNSMLFGHVMTSFGDTSAAALSIMYDFLW